MQLGKFKIPVLLATVTAMLLLSACGDSNNSKGETAAPSAGASAAPGSASAAPGSASASTEPSSSASAEAPADPMAKYDPAIELSTVVISDPTMKFENGDSVDNNKYYRTYEKELGIKLTNLWVADQSQRDQKMNLAISSNDLPDILHVDAKQLQLLYRSGKLADLTDVYEQYATPFTKQFLTVDGGFNLESG